MSSGSTAVLSKKSVYVNAEIFFEWLKNHLLPRKPLETIMLILDGHTSYCSSLQVLELAEMNGILLMCIPNHAAHYLQPLDQSVFKTLKYHFYNAFQIK